MAGDWLVYAWLEGPRKQRRVRVGVGGRLVIEPEIVQQRQRTGATMILETPRDLLETERSLTWQEFRALARKSGVEVRAAERMSRALTREPNVAARLMRHFYSRLRR